MSAMFFYGTLCHAPLRAAVLGREAPVRPATLAGHAVRLAAEQDFPMLVAEPGSVVQGVLAEGLTEADRARLAFYEGGFAFVTREVMVEAGGQVATAVFWPEEGRWQPDGPWDFAGWLERWGDTVTEAAGDFMALYGHADAAAVLARYPQMLVRGGARVRARQVKPTEQRRSAGPGDVQVAAFRQPYARFFSVEEHDISWRRFDGQMTAPVTRATFVSADAVVVLPYDPVRDRVLVVEQFRMGPFVRGDAQPWLLEPVAGRIDGGETPESCALRETEEEAGLTLRALVAGPSCYASPGAKTEYLYTFVGLVDLPDGSGGIGGLELETEDIRGHVLPFEQLLALIDSGEVDLAPLIVLAYWLDRQRPRLRAEAAEALRAAE